MLLRLPHSVALALTLIGLMEITSSLESARAENTPPHPILPPISARFAPHGDAPPKVDEVPDFQKHVSPLLGRLGCNGRACHGSFQGQGGFQLSLFGYDFDADHAALLSKDSTRVDLEHKLESLILTKPVSDDEHDGGKRFEPGGWEYWVLRRWIEQGAPYAPQKVQAIERLEVTPIELSFSQAGQQQPLKAIAHWADGTREDVTGLCRFQSNDEAIAAVDSTGLVTSGEGGDTHVVVSYDSAVVPILAFRPLSNQTGDNYPQVATTTEVDRLVLQKLKKLGIVPSEICSDEEFLRRAALDVTGTLPTADEVRAFVANTAADKRARKLEELLERPSYAAQWTTFLCDMTGNNEDQLRNFLPQNIRPENQWYQWIYQRVRDNVPYDQIVEGIVTANSRLPDESYRDYCMAMSEICQDDSGEKFAERPGLVHYWARNNFRTAEERAIGFAYSFLGVRIQCAQCHKHPFDQWSKADFENFERLFGAVQANQNTLAKDAKSEFAQMVKELDVDESLKGNQLRQALGNLLKAGKPIPFPELTVRGDDIRTPGNTGKGKPNAKNAKVVTVPKAKLLGGDWIEMDEADIRGRLMDWLRAPENPYFAKAIVNRVWAHYFGSGIVNPPDDLNLANAPSNAPLLEHLAAGFIEHTYDLKWLHREIVNSDCYQRSWIVNSTNALDHRNFSHSRLRRLPAEATYDAVRMALANDEMVEKSRELELPRALTKPGASARVVGRDDLSYALTVFGRSVRESNCDCDRSSEPSLLQTVFLVNDSAVQQWLRDPKTSWVASVARKYGWDQAAPSAARAALAPALSEQQDRLRETKSKFAVRLSDLDKRLQLARENKRTRQIETLEQQRQQLIDQVKTFARKNDLAGNWKAILKSDDSILSSPSTLPDSQPDSTAGMTEERALWIAENAYLRTLSRKPNGQELVTSMNYLKTETDPSLAVEGLMWGLINTKEFILNH